jgi:hypothetical protein
VEHRLLDFPKEQSIVTSAAALTISSQKLPDLQEVKRKTG